MHVAYEERKGNVLRRPRVPCSITHGIDLTSGCAHGCLYCYARGYETYPGDGRVVLYANSLAKLRCELPRKRKRPLGVSFSAYSDPFQPVPEVLNLTYDVLAYLLRRRMPVSILTKGLIPDRHMELLCAHADLVHFRAGLITLNESIADTFEPNCTPPRRRLTQLRELNSAGVTTGVRMDPILPEITDDADSIGRLCSAIARAGTGTISPSVLFLRPAIARNLRRHLRDRPLLTRLMRALRGAIRLPIHDGASVVTAPATDQRRATYRRVRQAADHHGLRMRLCSCKNSDLTSEHCTGVPEWLHGLPRPRQTGLFTDARGGR